MHVYRKDHFSHCFTQAPSSTNFLTLSFIVTRVATSLIMDANLHVIDSEGGLLLLVEDRLGRLQVRIYRAGKCLYMPSIEICECYLSLKGSKLGASTPLSTPGTLASSESLPDEKANALASISDDSDIESDTFTLLSRHNDEEAQFLKLRDLISSKHLALASHFSA